MGEKTDKKTWIRQNATLVSSIVGAVVAIIGFWKLLDAQIESVVANSTTAITQEIHKSSGHIGDFLINDLRSRIIVLEDEIGEIEDRGDKVPRSMKRHLQTLEELLTEAKVKW